MYDKLADFYEISNGSYHRYYPDKKWDMLEEEIKAPINEALIKVGVKFPTPEKNPKGYYYVLLHFDW